MTNKEKQIKAVEIVKAINAKKSHMIFLAGFKHVEHDSATCLKYLSELHEQIITNMKPGGHRKAIVEALGEDLVQQIENLMK